MEFLLSMKKKAQEGDATAQFTLGWTYELGKSVPQDYEIGFSWYICRASVVDMLPSFGGTLHHFISPTF